MFGFRSKSKSKPVEQQQPAVRLPKNPCTRDKIDTLISLENRLTQNKLTEEVVLELLAIYSVV